MRDPGSKWLPLPEAGVPDGYTKTQFIVHSTGDNGSALNIEQYFARGSVVVESTFIIGLDPSDPTLQIMDSTDNADANLSANQRAISVECVGDGTGPFTDWQVKELIRIGRWARANHPIAARVIPSEAESGFGWHVMFGAPGPWTNARGKICPGPVRIAQLQSTIFPAIFAGSTPEPQPVQEDTDMPLLVRNQAGTIALVTDVAVWVPDDVSNKGLQAKLGAPVQVSDKFFASLTAAENKDANSLAHLEKIVGDWAVRAQKPDWSSLVSALVAALPPVDVAKLAADLAADIKATAPAKAAPVKAAVAKSTKG